MRSNAEFVVWLAQEKYPEGQPDAPLIVFLGTNKQEAAVVARELSRHPDVADDPNYSVGSGSKSDFSRLIGTNRSRFSMLDYEEDGPPEEWAAVVESGQEKYLRRWGK